MATGVHDKYNVAINGQGYMLQNAPGAPAYIKSGALSEVDRLAVSDLAYSDFAGNGLFYIAQTDWSNGIKEKKIWADDAKYYYSSNIDAYSSHGDLKLHKEWVAENDFAETIYTGGSFAVGGSVNLYAGCGEDGSGNVKIYKEDSGWSDISSTDFNVTQELCSQLLDHKDQLIALTQGLGPTDVVAGYSGAAWTDYSATIVAAVTGATIESARAGCVVADVLYVGYDDAGANETGIVSTDDGGTTWTEQVYKSTDALIVSMANYINKVYYLLRYTNGVMELRVFNPANSTDGWVHTFLGANTGSILYGVGDKLLKVFGGRLIITIPDDNIYEYDGIDLTLLFNRDADKKAIGKEADAYLLYGAVEHDNKLHWGNLVYDGVAFYNWKKPLDNLTTYWFYPIFADSSDNIYGITTEDRTILYEEAATYKSTLAKNLLVFNEMSQISAIEKILHSVTAIFDVMAANEQIQLDYSIDNRTSWVTVGTLTSATEGSGITREIVIPGNIIFKKIWWRILLDGTATTPIIHDVVMAYRPMPDHKHRWTMRINCTNGTKLLDGQHEERDASDLVHQLWNEKFYKQRVTFEDADYVECSLVSAMASGDTSCRVNKTKRFSRAGRIRAVSGGVAEEMYFVSAHSTKLEGLTRGVRGTKARDYIAGQTLANDYDVYVEDVKNELAFTDENKTESIAQVLLLEA